MIVMTANKKKLFDIKEGICIANVSDEYKGKYNVFYTGKINTEINGEKMKSVIIASCRDEREAEKYLSWLCDELNDRWYPKG